MEQPIPEQHSLRQLFGVLTEKNFAETLGWADFQVTHYVANLLVEFAHVDQLHRITNRAGEPVESVVDLLFETESLEDTADLEREKTVHRHIGDFTLFMAGLFPEYLRRIKASGLIHHKDFLVDYVKAGKRSYGIVASYQSEEPQETAALFQTLSTNFELCVTGLGFVRLELDRMQDSAYGQAKDLFLN